MTPPLGFSRLTLKTPEDIRRLPNFVPDLDHSTDVIERVETIYYVKPMMRCALCRQHQRHNEGAVVALVGGKRTALGVDCASRFDSTFGEKLRDYQDRVLRPELIERLRDRKAFAAQRLPRARDLQGKMQQFIEWRTAFKRLFPLASQLLSRRAAKDDAKITVAVERSAASREDAEALGGQRAGDALRYEQVVVAEIRGLPFFDPSRAPAMNASQVCSELERLTDMPLENIALSELQELDRIQTNCDENLASIDRWHATIREFFSAQNFAAIAKDPAVGKEAKMLATLEPDQLQRLFDASQQPPSKEVKPRLRTHRGWNRRAA